MRRKRPEQTLQIAVASFLRAALRAPTYWTAIDHGVGKLGVVEATLRKKRGVKAGIADMLVIQRHGDRMRPMVVWIELKADKGSQSLGQKMFQAAVEENGCIYFVARSVDEVSGFLRGVGIPLHARLS